MLLTDSTSTPHGLRARMCNRTSHPRGFTHSLILSFTHSMCIMCHCATRHKHAHKPRTCTRVAVLVSAPVECQGSEELLSPRSSSAARSVTLPLTATTLTLRTQSRRSLSTRQDYKAFFSVFLPRYAHGGILFSVFASVVVFIASTVLRRSTFGVCVL